MNNLGLKNKFKSYDDLFRGSESDSELPVTDISIDKLVTFENHPFKVKNDERYKELKESIKAQGVIVPGVARSLSDGRYEIISGHTRKTICEELGIPTMPMIIKDVDKDTATVLMVDSNIQREIISISEKAKAYRMKYEAIKNQGINSLKAMSEESGDNAKTIQRFIRLGYLNDDLLFLLDEKKLGIRAGVEISYIKPEEQVILYEVLSEYNYKLSIDEAVRLRNLSESIGLKKSVIIKEIGISPTGEATAINNKSIKQSVSIKRKKLEKYFPAAYSVEEIETKIIEILDQWSIQSEREV